MANKKKPTKKTKAPTVTPFAKKAILDPKEIFRHAAWFDYATGLLWLDTNARLNRTSKPITEPLPPQFVLPKIGSGVKLAQLKVDQTPPAVIPQIINSIMSVELYLKSLLVLETGKRAEVHTLSQLFAALPSVRQQRIEKLYYEEFDKNPILVHVRDTATDRHRFDLVPLLTRNDRIFVDVRYSYELTGFEADNLKPVGNATCRVILEIKPEWQSILESLGPLPTLLYR